MRQQIYIKRFSGSQVYWVTSVFFILIEYLVRSDRFSEKIISFFTIISTFYIISLIFGLKDKRKRK